MLTEETIESCRQTNLYTFIKSYDPHSWKQEGSHYLRSKQHDSCVICSNGNWYWNSRGLSGKNPIDFICNFYGLSFRKAIELILSYPTTFILKEENLKFIEMPLRFENHYAELYFYLCRIRKLKYSIVAGLIKDRKIYLTLEAGYKNICFINPENNHFELKGISSKPFKRISDANNYWSCGNKDSNISYICESAIDAISLYQILNNENVICLSIGGSVTRKKLVESILKEYPYTTLAIDNDASGNRLASFFPNVPRIIPTMKDWNEDLIAFHSGAT